jgi:hypothetical protein
MFGEINEQKLNSMYDDFSREQLKLLGELKTGTSDLSKDIEIQKQLSLLNTLMINTLRLRNLKKKIAAN